MREDKYEDILYFVEMLCDNEEINFDEKIAKIILMLDDKEKVNKLDVTDWVKLTKTCEETIDVALMVAILKNPQAPDFCTEKIADMAHGSYNLLTFISDKVTPQIIQKVANKLGVESLGEFIGREGQFFSNKTIDYLCNLPKNYLVSLNYLPFSLVNKECETYKKIQAMVENENERYFEGDAPVNFLSQIISNRNIDNGIRELAFSKGYDPDNLIDVTNEMAKELYASCVDTIFDINAETVEEKKAQESADGFITFLAQTKQLPISCQLDLVERLRNFPHIRLNCVNRILTQNLHTSQVIKEAVHIPSKDVFDIIKNNKTMITNNVLTEMLKIRPVDSLEDVFISSCLRHTIDTPIVKKFFNRKNTAIDMALLASYHTPFKQYDSLLKVNSKSAKPKPELEYLKEIREFIFNHYNMPMSQLIMNEILYSLITNSEDYFNGIYHRPNTAQERLFQEIQKNRGWCRISNESKPELDKFFNEIKNNSKFIEFSDVTNEIVENMNEAYRKSFLPNKYPIMFSRKYGEYDDKWDVQPYIKDTVFRGMCMDEIINLSNEGMDKFIKDIKECNDEPTLSAILYRLKSELDKKEYLNFDIVYKHIYKFADLYSTLNDEIDKLRDERNKANINEEISL